MALKVYDLQCDQNHVFEGWFSSEENYDTQRAGGLLSCPFCNSTQVNRKLSAPRLNVSHIKADQPAAGQIQASGERNVQMAHMQAEIMRHIRQVLRNTENVGDRFAQEARRMHEGEVEERAIRGTATAQERDQLMQDGIAVVAIPDFLDEDRMQ